MNKVMFKTNENRICETEGCTNVGRYIRKNKDGIRKRGNLCQKHYLENLARNKNKKVTKNDDKRIIVDEQDFLDNHVNEITGWRRIDDIHTKNSKEYFKFIEEFGKPGIYQIAHKDNIDDMLDRIIHPETGYIGQASDVLGRTYSIRPVWGDHGVRIWLRTLQYFEPDNTTTVDDLRIRYFMTKESSPHKTIEDNLHDIMKSEYGYSFKWRRASEGTDGNSARCADFFLKLNVDDMKKMLPILSRITEDRVAQDAAEKARIEYRESQREMFGGL